MRPHTIARDALVPVGDKLLDQPAWPYSPLDATALAVVLRRDPIGPCVVIPRGRDREPLPIEPGIENKVVAQTADHGATIGAADLVERAIRFGELR